MPKEGRGGREVKGSSEGDQVNRVKLTRVKQSVEWRKPNDSVPQASLWFW